MYVLIMMMVFNCGGDDNDDTLFISLLPTNALPKIRAYYVWKETQLNSNVTETDINF